MSLTKMETSSQAYIHRDGRSRRVDGVVYTASVDIDPNARTGEPRRCGGCLSTRLHAAIADVDAASKGIELADTGLYQQTPVLPAGIRESFLAGDYYTPLDIDLDNTGDPARMGNVLNGFAQ